MAFYRNTFMNALKLTKDARFVAKDARFVAKDARFVAKDAKFVAKVEEKTKKKIRLGKRSKS